MSVVKEALDEAAAKGPLPVGEDDELAGYLRDLREKGTIGL